MKIVFMIYGVYIVLVFELEKNIKCPAVNSSMNN